MEIIPLDLELIHRANSNSFSGTRGDNSNASYLAYCQEILEWPIADTRKEKLLAEVHKRYSDALNYEAQHVSVMVAGPARYNFKKLDRSDQILRSYHDFCTWFDGIRKQVKSSTQPDDKLKQTLEMIEFCDSREEYDPAEGLMKLAFIDNTKFIELFEAMLPRYHWRKNSKVYKLYTQSKAGEVQEIRKEVVFEDDNLIAYKEGERYYIKFVLRCKRQLHVALKSRGWWWNSYKAAYSTYLNRFDLEWVQSISKRYEKYL